MNRKGMLDQVLILLVIGVLLAFIILLFYGYSIIAPTMKGTMNDLTNNALIPIQQSDSNLNTSLAPITEAAVKVNPFFDWIGYILLFACFVAFIFMAFVVRIYPIFSIFWLVIVAVLVFFSMYVSNWYDDNKIQDMAINSSYVASTFNDTLMTNLPYIVGGFGALLAIVLFVLIPRNQEVEAQGI